MELENFRREEKLPPQKLAIAQYVVAAVLLALVAGMWRLSVLGADSYRVLAEQNRVRKVPVLAPRGKIFDREGRIIVDNYPSVSCYLLREQTKNLDADMPRIAEGLHMTVDQIQAILKRYAYAPKYQPLPLKQDITPDEQAFIEAHRTELPELQTLDEQRRLYPRDGFMAHVIGYVGEVSENDLKQTRYAFYSPGDVVGKSGIEESYDEELRGQDGSRDVIVNSHGKEVGLMGQELAKPGRDLYLTIDLDLQKAAERALEGKTGAIVAMDPHTGEILAMASRPTFDPNQFAVRLSKAYWQSILDNPDHPLLNKAIQAQVAPGSTFKVIMTMAGLQENVAQNLTVSCNGGATFYGHFFGCDRHHGFVDIHNALPYSCDTYYYTLANRLGIDTMARYANSVGVGVKTGVDLPEEAAGTMPSEQWKMKVMHDKWYAGETISVGIGQGAIQATPLQMARALSGIASGGVLRRPHLVMDKELSADELSAVKQTFPGSGEKTIPLTPENWQIITDDMAGVTGPIGTAAEAHLEGVDFVGKTGTADVVSGRKKGDHNRNTIPNAWFVGMTPRRNPDIVVAVLWEHGYWGNNSAKLAAQVITAFVNKQREKAGNLVKVAAVKPQVGLGDAAPAADANSATTTPADPDAAHSPAKKDNE
ncbi:penicillin-binding protein 2 [Granulicella cerasi]|uniref:Penicillin-binding protein 2 n=1 Tax=Granulicella cerasi TaxID=741063 RepID=A0ABW1Z9T0_9BACT|nr:penicillin-binding protein 2 [Granulicella cerasi]